MKRTTNCSAALAAVLIGWTVQAAPPQDKHRTESPRAHDPRLQVDLFAASPDIVHPIGIDFDNRGRLLVIESHTHFRPPNYSGPKHDRVRLLEDTDGDGKADRFTTFFEGTRFTMDIAAHPDGSVYLATRNEILRLRDTDGDGKADEHRRIVFLETKGDYPHNGLSGLAFDSKGDLYFGLGENLGATYKLIGTDGTTLTGGGEGGGVFWCTADGRKLRRVATGFWNPFGVCRDIFGRIFAVDNDPDAMPPCRLVHVVEGGDYGYQFRYGRSGRHPFQSWDGQLPGTLPMVSGTGEAPCEVLSYESDGLPREYVGNLLVTSWADHRVERYRAQGARSIVHGGAQAVRAGRRELSSGRAGRGAGWLAVCQRLGAERLQSARQGGDLAHPAARVEQAGSPQRTRTRPVRMRTGRCASRRRAGSPPRRRGATSSAGNSTTATVRVRAASLTALIDAGDRKLDLTALAEKDTLTPIRALAVRALAERGADASRFLDAKYPPAVRLEAIASLKGVSAVPQLLKLLADPDPFLRNAAVRQLGRQPDLLGRVDVHSLKDPMERIGMLLAWRASGRDEGVRRVREFLGDPDDDVRFLGRQMDRRSETERISAATGRVAQGPRAECATVLRLFGGAGAPR